MGVKPGAARNNFDDPVLTAFTVTSDTKPESLSCIHSTLIIDESKLVTVKPSIFFGIRKFPCFAYT